MADVIQIVGDRVKYWTEQNNPDKKPGTFNRGRSDLRVEFLDIRYGNLVPFEFKPITIEESEFVNNGSLANAQRFVVSKKTTSNFTYTFKEGIGVKLKPTLKIPMVGGVGVETSVNFESTQEQSDGKEQSWSYSTDINIAPRKKVKVSFIVNQARYRVPFWARVQVRGRVFIDMQRNNTFNREISDLIEKLKWTPWTFEYEAEGTFDATHGEKYVVVVDEYDLVATPGGTHVERNRVQSVLDSGVLMDDRIQSEFQETAAMPDRG